MISRMTALLLAHGGTGGAIAEIAFLLIPVVAFVLLSRWSKRRERASDDPRPGSDAPSAPDDPPP